MIVLVDDDDMFRSALAANLRDDGYEVLEYEDSRGVPLEGVGEVEALLTDYLMGQEDGLQFAKRFHAAFPAAPVIMITAFATAHLEGAIAKLGYVSLLSKPLNYEELLNLLKKRGQGGSS